MLRGTNVVGESALIGDPRAPGCPNWIPSQTPDRRPTEMGGSTMHGAAHLQDPANQAADCECCFGSNDLSVLCF
jgi:hypothetical protein